MIALVITIIVLLILAGITLNLVIGDNGIINRSKQAGKEYTKASLKEELQLKIADIEMEKLANGEQLTRDDLQDLSKIGAIVLDTGIPALGEYKDYDFEVDENFEVTIGSKLKGVKPTANAEVITTGYVTEGGKIEIKVSASTTEGTITNIEATNGATIKTNTSDTEKYFEVSKNGTYYFKITGSNGRKIVVSVEVNTILESPQIKIKNIIDDGFTIQVQTPYETGLVTEFHYYVNKTLKKNGTTDFEYVVRGLNEDTEYSNIYVVAYFKGITTGLESNKLNIKTKGEIAEVVWTNTTLTNQTIDGKTASYKNPKIPVGFSAVTTGSAKWNKENGEQSDWNNGLVIKNATDGNEFVWIPIDNTNVTYAKWCTTGTSYANCTDVESPTSIGSNSNVTTNQGFWIARYEAGLPEDMDQTNTGVRNVAGKPVSKAGKVPWNFIDFNHSKENAESMYSNSYVQTGLVNGTQWDTIMKWLENAGYNVTTNSSSWGNYSNVIRNLRTGKYAYYSNNFGSTWISSNIKPSGRYLMKTGASNEAKANNLYDLAGSLWEYTSENSYVCRGGLDAYSGESYPAAYRFNINGGYLADHIGFRVVLYVL